MMYKRILVATGGSPWSNAALTYAIGLATRTGAELRILTVLTDPALPGGADRDAQSLQRVMASVEGEGQALLAQSANRALRARVVHATHCTWGTIPTTILQTAAEEACDLIVLGSRRVTGSQRHKLGTIANVVAAQAPQPVLIVKRPLAPDVLRGRRLLVATGGSPWSKAALAHALQIAQAQEWEVCLLHADQSQSRPGNGLAASESKQLLTQAEAQAAAAGVTYEGVLAAGPVADTILAMAHRKQCSAIILGSRGVAGWKRPMLGSIVNTVAARAALPVLIVKHFLRA